MNTQLLTLVEQATTRTAKMNLLKSVDEDTKRFVCLAVDPYVTFGLHIGDDVAALTDDQFPTLGLRPEDCHRHQLRNTRVVSAASALWWASYAELLYALRDRKVEHSKLVVRDVLSSAPTSTDIEWAVRILNKDLKAGFTAKTARKVWPNCVRAFDIAKAFPYKRGEDLFGPRIFEPKYDGHRLLLVGEDTLSSNGRYVTGLRHIVRLFGQVLDRWVVDGEWIGGGMFEDTMSGTRSDDRERDGHYRIFDFVARDEWDAQDTRPLWQRKIDLLQQVGPLVCSTLRLVPYWYVYSPTYTEALKWRDVFLNRGLEGAMLKRFDQPYRFTRHKDVWKFKKMHTMEALIVGTYKGEPGSKYEGMLGGFNLQLEDGTLTDCGGGPGMTDAFRMKTGNEAIGRVCEVKFQNRTKYGKLRFAEFQWYREDKDPEDVEDHDHDDEDV